MVQPLVIKFGSLVIKTLTKPVANQIKHKAQQPGWIRQVRQSITQPHSQA